MRILEAAASLFAAQGFDGTSTRQVGGAASANIGTIAYHFGGKEGLYEASLARMYERLLELQLPDELGADPEARIRAAVAAVWRFCRKEREAVRLLLRHLVERGSLPPAVREAWAHRLLERALELQSALDLPSLAEHRLTLLSLNHLIARYAISPAADLAPFAGAGDPEAAVERHLGDVAVALLIRVW